METQATYYVLQVIVIVIRTCFLAFCVKQNCGSVSRTKSCPHLVGPGEQAMRDSVGRSQSVRPILVIDRHCAPGGLILPNLSKPVRRKSRVLFTKSGQISVDRIIGIRLKRFFADRNLRIRVVYFKLAGRGIGPGRDFGFYKPQAEVCEDFFDDFLILDKADDPHGAVAFRAGERVYLVDFLNQPGPILPIRLETFVRLQNARNPRIPTLLLAFSAANVAVIAVVANHLRTKVSDLHI